MGIFSCSVYDDQSRVSPSVSRSYAAAFWRLPKLLVTLSWGLTQLSLPAKLRGWTMKAVTVQKSSFGPWIWQGSSREPPAGRHW